jgi:two-component system chemotaxis sensor kinase CheA
VTGIQERLAAAFRVEHREHLQVVRSLLDSLAAAGYDTSSFDFNEAYRRVHSLKGAARAVGLLPVETLSHHLETLMGQCQSGQRDLNRDVVSLLHMSFDEIEDFVSQWTGTIEERPLAILSVVEQLLTGAAPPPQPKAAPAPSQQAAGLSRETTASRSQTTELARVETGRLDVALRSAGELVSRIRQNDAVAQDLRGLEQAFDRLETMLARPDYAPDRQAGWDASTRALLDGIRAQVKEVRRRQQDRSWQLGRLSRRLFDDIRILRIMPADSVFDGIGPMVRDLARQAGKQIHATVLGGDTRVDREVLQALKDPVMHLLRNAVSHGIEPAAERERAGKPADGHITLRIAVQRNHLVVRIEDDGAGLDVARICRIAVERGVLAKDTTLDGDFDAVTRLLVNPGFTTTTAVTEISGRGIGLAVVDQAVQRLQGTFRMAPREAGGTEAILTVPLAVIGTKVLVVRCGSQDFAIPVHAIQRLHQLSPEAVDMADGEPAFALPGRADLVPLTDLAQLLDLASDLDRTAAEKLSVILIQAGSTVIGVVVDEFRAVLDAVIHGLSETLPDHGLLAGMIALPEGGAAAVINPSALFKAVAVMPHRSGISYAPAPRTERVPLILVVDDSITTRTLERSILESRGFRVQLGVDGSDALSLLAQERPDLVITDVEMPRMDGFDLLHNMKNDERYAGIPVILVTSRDDEQDRRKGLTLGAAAYIVKQSFDQWQLLEAVEQIL